MNSTVQNLEKSQVELKTTIDGDTWKAAQEKAFNKISKNVQIPGFRKGTAPKNLVKKHISSNEVLMEAVDLVAQNAFAEGCEANDLFPIARPRLDLEAISEESVTLKFIITVKPTVTLGDYKELPYELERVRILKKDIDAEVEKLQNEYAQLVVKEGTVENGDTAVIDFEGFKDGVAFEGGKGENYPLVIGSGSFIPGFEEQLIGMTQEETKEINVTFPEQYQSADLAGKEAVFKVTVHEIKTRQVPELNDEFAKDVDIEGVETLDQLKDKIKKDLSDTRKQQAEQTADNKLIEKAVENASVEIPDVMITEEAQRMVQDQAYRIQQQYGLPFEQFLKMVNQTVEQVLEGMKPNAEKQVRTRLVLDAVATAEKLEANEEEVENEYTKIAEEYNMDVADVKKQIDVPSISYDIVLRKAFNFIKDSSVKSK